MDHIVGLPTGLVDDETWVPYIPGARYDDPAYEFEEFPQRQGWDIQKLADGDIGHHTQFQCARFMQSWTFFGLLSVFLGTNIDPEDFCSECAQVEGGIRLSTIFLERRLARWQSRLLQNTPDGNTAAAVAVLRSLSAVSNITRHRALIDLMGPKLHLVVCILGATLDRARVTLGIFPPPVEKSVFTSNTMHHDLYFRFGPSRFLVHRLRYRGWCPNQIVNMDERLTPIGMYYMSVLPGQYGRDAHQTCTTEKCAVNCLKEEDYVTKHTTPNCSCEFYQADTNIVTKALTEGAIPLIGVSRSRTDQRLEVRIRSNKADTSRERPRSYTAISHVWRDGLGNPQKNALPLCQLQRLASMVERIHYRTDSEINSKLNDRAIPNGIGSTTLDDLVYKVKLGCVTRDLVPGPLVDEFYRRFPDVSSSLNLPRRALEDWAGDAYTSRDCFAQSGQFLFDVYDGPDHTYLSKEASRGDVNFDWKAYDEKEFYPMRRFLSDNEGPESEVVSSETLFWLDTLCIPREREPRRLAIQRIKETFADAENVLVIDSEIERIASAESFEEILFRINSSTWMQRAWTLEEAVFSSKLLFQLADGVLNMFQFGRTWFKSQSRSMIMADATRPWQMMRRMQQPRHSLQQMQTAYDTLEGRVTSKEKDLNIIFSTLMGVNIKASLQPPEQWPARARKFADLQERFPQIRCWVPNLERNQNYVWTAISAIDHAVDGVVAWGREERYGKLRQEQRDLENLHSFREQPGFVIRCPAFSITCHEEDIMSFTELIVTHRRHGYAFHIERKNPKDDVQVTRRDGDTTVLLLPNGLRKNEPTTKARGMLAAFWTRFDLGGSDSSRIGVNFATFLSEVVVTVPLGFTDTHTTEQDRMYAFSKARSVFTPDDGGSRAVIQAGLEDIYRKDTMWAIE